MRRNSNVLRPSLALGSPGLVISTRYKHDVHIILLTLLQIFDDEYSRTSKYLKDSMTLEMIYHPYTILGSEQRMVFGPKFMVHVVPAEVGPKGPRKRKDFTVWFQGPIQEGYLNSCFGGPLCLNSIQSTKYYIAGTKIPYTIHAKLDPHVYVVFL